MLFFPELLQYVCVEPELAVVKEGGGWSNSDVHFADWMERERPAPGSIHLSAAEISVTVNLFMP